MHSSTYPIVYDPAAASTVADAFWIITEIGTGSGKYTIQNASTKQYISYDTNYDPKRNLTLVDALNGDTTLFKLTLHTVNGVDYYSISSVAVPGLVFNRRGSDKENMVGFYTHDGSSTNEQFAFYDASGAVVKDDAVTVIVDEGTALAVSGPLAAYLGEFSLSGKPLVYNKRSGFSTYFFSVPLTLMDNDVERTVHFTVKNTAYTVTINGTKVTDESDYTFADVTAGKNFTIKIMNGTRELLSTTLTFTGLPIVQMTYASVNGNVYSPGFITVHEPAKNLTPEKLNSEYKWRGATAMGQAKKSFNIKLKDALGEKMHKSFFGLREDNNWVLDAMAIDYARMRNRVSTDLWNDFSTPPYQTSFENGVINGTRGQFVEVFINEEYSGLYCMTEKVDRKQLKLKKYDEVTKQVNGVLYKSTDWSFEVFMGGSNNDQPQKTSVPDPMDYQGESWNGFEAKYPDLGDGEVVDWRPLYSAVNFTAFSSNDYFASNVNQAFDMPVMTDYYLFIELLLATDNQGKNMYFYAYDKNTSGKISVAPWDCDGTFGRRWNGSKDWGSGNCLPEQDFTAFVIANEHGQSNLFMRLMQGNVNGFNNSLRMRYAQLRSTFFSPEKLIARFTAYNAMFEKSGAGAREVSRWNGYSVSNLNFQSEINFLTDWITRRIAYLDNQYDYGSLGKKAPQITLSIPDTITYGDGAVDFTLTSTNKETPIKYSFSVPDIFSVNETSTKLIPLRAGSLLLNVSQAYSDTYAKLDTSIFMKVYKKNLYVIADNKQKESGTANPDFSYHYEGLLPTDNLAQVFSIYPTVSCEATAESPDGEYPIVASKGFVLARVNYNIVPVNGVLTIGSIQSGAKDETISVGIYPNPVSDVLRISNLAQGTSVIIVDSYGRIIYSGKADEEEMQIDLRGRDAGLYYLKAGDKSYKIIKK
ncbi:MAG: CotH kinase family protein [Bacteroidales bacterium]|nr:CotH kinase family protein [Bacteroidales bacterium]